MAISSLEISVLVVSAMAVIIMSFVFPPLGMAGDSVNSTEIPEFNTTANTFSWEKEQPAAPGGPSKGYLNHSSDQFDSFRGSIQYELGKNDNGNRTVIIANPEDEVALSDIEKVQNNELDNHTFTQNDTTVTLSGGGFEIDVKSVNIATGEYQFIVTQRPADQNWASGIPVLGGTWSGAEQLAATVGWLGAMLFYFLERFAVATTNTFIIFFNVVVFLIDLLHFVLSIYFGIVDNSPSEWASVLTAIPGIVLSIEFSRIAFMLIKKIPGIG